MFFVDNCLFMFLILFSEHVECDGDESNSEHERQTVPPVFEKIERLSNKVMV